MASANSQLLPAPPSLTKSLLAGFDAVSSKLGIVLFSIVLDLFLWMGPRVPLRSLVASLVEQLPVMTNKQVLLDASQELNLLSSLRSYPIGIPSLMASRGLLSAPIFGSWSLDVPSWNAAAVIWVCLTLVGIMLGTVYFSMLSVAALERKFDWKALLLNLPWDYWQIMKLTVMMFLIAIGLSIPFICLFSLLGVTGFSTSMVFIFPYLMVLVWFFFPLIFSPHGVFVNRKNSWESVRESAKLVRWTFPASALFIGAALIINEGLNVLWRVPPDKSWFHLVGITGHAFVSAGLIAASFIYYHEAGLWVQKAAQKVGNLPVERSS